MFDQTNSATQREVKVPQTITAGLKKAARSKMTGKNAAKHYRKRATKG